MEILTARRDEAVFQHQTAAIWTELEVWNKGLFNRFNKN